MTDTASLIARVKAEGVEQTARELDNLASSAVMAQAQSDALTRAQKKLSAETKNTSTAVRNYSTVTEALGNKIAIMEEAQEKGARAAAILAAQLRAGENASKSELDAIAQLTGKLYDMNEAQQKLSTGGKAANDSLGRFRNTAGQAGYQIQDLVVQLQGGTSAFVAFGQQGSQLAGAFGPGGAVLGAVIALASAIGGVLYKAFTDTGASAKELEKGASELSKSFQTAKDGSIEFSDALIQLSQNGDAAYSSMIKLISLQAKQQLDNTTTAIREQSKEFSGSGVAAQTNATALDELISKNKDAASVLENLNVVTDAASGKYANLAGYVKDLAAGYGVGVREVTDMLVTQREFNNEPTAENAQKVADATTRAAAAATKNKKELLDQAEASQKNAIALATAEKQLNLVSDAQKRAGDATNSTTKRIQEQNDALVKAAQIAVLSERERAKAQADADKETFAKREGVTKEQIAAYNAARDEEARQDIARIDKTEKEKTDRINAAAARREKASATRAESESQRQQKAADQFLATLQRQNTDELKAIDAQEQQKLEKLQKFNEMGRIVGKQYEDAKTQITLDADAKRNELLQKQNEDRMKGQSSADSFLEQLRAQNEGELAEIDRQQEIKMKKLSDFHAKGLVKEKDYADAVRNIQGEADKKRYEEYDKTLDEIGSALKSNLGENSQIYKAYTVSLALMDTYRAATAAMASAAATPITGWEQALTVWGPTVAAGLNAVAAIKGIATAREQGGYLAAGQVSTIAERGKPEVIMPAGASRVRTAQQMRQIMGENTGASRSDSVVIVNQTTGRIDSAQTERDDEGRLRVLIREVVAGDMSDSNSSISKARRNTRGQPGFA